MIDAELEKVAQSFEDLMDEVVKYQTTLEFENEKKFAKQKFFEIEESIEEIPKESLDIAGSIGIWEVILRAMTKDAQDFRTACDAIIFPAVYEQIVDGNPFYLLKEVPSSATAVIQQGRELLTWLREEFDTYLTYNDVWPVASEVVSDWWLGTGLPLMYGSRDEAWDEVKPYTIVDMDVWKNYPADREIEFAKVTSAYQFWKQYSDDVRDSYGIDQFEIKTFSF